jgi:S1-C subfamily serine protease
MVRLIAETPETLPVSIAVPDHAETEQSTNYVRVPHQPLTLADTFDLVRPTIIAFASRLVQTPVGGKPLFPAIIGTGFVVDADGIVVTNDHVIEALQKLPPHPVTGAPSPVAIVCANPELVGEGHALPMLFIEIKGYSRISSFKSQGPFYGEDVPDIGFVQLKVRGLPAVALADWPHAQRQGAEVATAGFPLGTDPLVAYGKVSQLTPLLRRGIISSLLPFPCPYPHGFTLDIMSQGGASGSPVFLTDQPSVVGIVHAGIEDTNLTYAIPSILIRDALSVCTNGDSLDLTDVPTLESLIAQGPRTDELRWDSFIQRMPPNTRT